MDLYNSTFLDILWTCVEEFLLWTRTMKAKPAKCKAHAVKKFVPYKKMRQVGHKTQYDPKRNQLTIGGKEITFIHS